MRNRSQYSSIARRASRTAWLLIGLLALTACTALTRTEPVAVESASTTVVRGDVVQLETITGRWMSFEVDRVTATHLEAAGASVALAEVASLNRIIGDRGPVCGGRKPLECSVPDPLVEVADYHDEFVSRFHEDCVAHDYCYRHGRRTYGLTRAECDEQFRTDMRKRCERSLITLDILDKLEDSGRCLLVAEEFYRGVVKYGESAFRTHDSSYCEYAGTP